MVRVLTAALLATALILGTAGWLRDPGPDPHRADCLAALDHADEVMDGYGAYLAAIRADREDGVPMDVEQAQVWVDQIDSNDEAYVAAYDRCHGDQATVEPAPRPQAAPTPTGGDLSEAIDLTRAIRDRATAGGGR